MENIFKELTGGILTGGNTLAGALSLRTSGKLGKNTFGGMFQTYFLPFSI